MIPPLPLSLNGLDGSTVELPQALDRGPVLLAFGKSECGACRLAFPYIQKLYTMLPAEKWTLVGVMQDTTFDARKYASEFGLTFPVVRDLVPYEISRAFDPEATPSLLLIEKDCESTEGAKISRVVMGFSKAEYNSLADELALKLGVEPFVLATDDDGKPALRPG